MALHSSHLMLRPYPCVFLLVLVGVAHALPRPSSSATGCRAAREWTAIDGELKSPSLPKSFTLAVAQRKMGLLRRKVAELSDPTSSEYGNYLSLTEVNSMVVSPSHVARVVKWLENRGVSASSYEVKGSFIDMAITASDASHVFSATGDPTTLHLWQNSAHRRLIVRANISASDRASGAWKERLLPPEVRDSVDAIIGLYDFPLLPARSQRPAFSARAGPSQSNAPNLMGVLASDTTIYLQFQPLCRDGSPAAQDMCAQSSPPAISTFKLTQSSPDGKVLSTTSVGCGGSGMSCQSHSPTPGAFLLVNVSLQTEYADGSKSEIADGGDATLTTPFVDVKLNNIFYSLPANNSIARRFSAWTQCAVEFSHNYFSMHDLDEYFQYNQLNPDVKVSVHGPDNQNNPEGEADQDMQWVMGTGVQVDTVFWSTKNASGFVLDWLKEVAGTPDDSAPKVYSISYGQPEALVPPMFGSGYMERSEEEFIKMAARGMSVAVADGDSGSSNGLGCSDTTLYPDWPASSPHVTSCGGTTISSYDLPSTAVAVSTRTGVAYTTGGGFSSVFPRPSYQDQAVSEYLSTHPSSLPPPRMFNSSNRAFPDVGVLGYNLLTFYHGQNWINPFPGGGTSFSAPIMAGMISRWNVIRHSQGKPPMGLVNPWLYQAKAKDPSTFYDIVTGDNACVGADRPCCKYGFYCVKGYDAVSGLGSPYFDKLTTHVMTPFY